MTNSSSTSRSTNRTNSSPRILDAMKTALPLPHGVPVEVEHGTGPNWLAAH